MGSPNIISNIFKSQPSAALMGWMAEQTDEDLFIASLTVAELRRGILEQPPGKRRDQLAAWTVIKVSRCYTPPLNPVLAGWPAGYDIQKRHNIPIGKAK